MCEGVVGELILIVIWKDRDGRVVEGYRMMKQDKRYLRPGFSMRTPHAVRLDEQCEREALEAVEKRDRLGMRLSTRVSVSSDPPVHATFSA